MAMLRSAVGLAFRQSAQAPRFFGNAGRRNPPPISTSKRNYFSSSEYEFHKKDFTDWNGMHFLFGTVGFAVGLFFYHNLRESRYNTTPCQTKSTCDIRHYGQEKVEEKELSESSRYN